jgi:hypothetical protein
VSFLHVGDSRSWLYSSTEKRQKTLMGFVTSSLYIFSVLLSGKKVRKGQVHFPATLTPRQTIKQVAKCDLQEHGGKFCGGNSKAKLPKHVSCWAIWAGTSHICAAYVLQTQWQKNFPFCLLFGPFLSFASLCQASWRKGNAVDTVNQWRCFM